MTQLLYLQRPLQCCIYLLLFLLYWSVEILPVFNQRLCNWYSECIDDVYVYVNSETLWCHWFDIEFLLINVYES